MYTFIKLTVPPPSMAIFDASNRDQCEVKRLKTNTPLQALLMMNDPTVLEASRVLAQKLVSEKSTAEEKIIKAFRDIVCRRPSENELSILKKYFDEQISFFRSNKLNALTTLKVGEFPLNDKLDLNMSAAMTKVISSIYNLDETITKT
jgi:hypothetical protein